MSRHKEETVDKVGERGEPGAQSFDLTLWHESGATHRDGVRVGTSNQAHTLVLIYVCT